MAKNVLCKGCTRIFTPTKKGQKFHNNDCRTRWYREHYFNQKEPIEKTCPECGTTFETTREWQTYCGPDCRSEAQKKRIYGEEISSGTCQLCEKEFKNLGTYPLDGRVLKLCEKCRIVVDAVESGLVDKLVNL